MENSLGWMIMEFSALFVFLFFFLSGSMQKYPAQWIFLGLWIIHYVQRTFIYPLRIKTKGKKMPVVIVVFALIFNAINGYVNGYYLGTPSDHYDVSWLNDPRFILGTTFFFSGMLINWFSDTKLIHLRKKDKNGYSIPDGGLFRLVSCPNFFGEMIEWLGFALLTWCLPAFSFFLWTIVNLIPRALAHHTWYKQQFDNYPLERKAVIPYLL